MKSDLPWCNIHLDSLHRQIGLLQSPLGRHCVAQQFIAGCQWHDVLSPAGRHHAKSHEYPWKITT